MNEETANNTIEKLSEIDYKKNPQEFDALADKLISDFISAQPEERRKKLQGMQFRISHELSKFPTPEGRWQRMQEMFIKEVFEKENGFIDVMMKIGGHREGDITPPKKEEIQAKVIPLKK